jgi:hypothetical protein
VHFSPSYYICEIENVNKHYSYREIYHDTFSYLTVDDEEILCFKLINYRLCLYEVDCSCLTTLKYGTTLNGDNTGI